MRLAGCFFLVSDGRVPGAVGVVSEHGPSHSFRGDADADACWCSGWQVLARGTCVRCCCALRRCPLRPGITGVLTKPLHLARRPNTRCHIVVGPSLKNLGYGSLLPRYVCTHRARTDVSFCAQRAPKEIDLPNMNHQRALQAPPRKIPAAPAAARMFSGPARMMRRALEASGGCVPSAKDVSPVR